MDPKHTRRYHKPYTEDIRNLISEEKIGKRAIQGVSRAEPARLMRPRVWAQKRHGSRSGAKGARNPGRSNG